MGINFLAAGSAVISMVSSSTLDDQQPFTISAWINPRTNGPAIGTDSSGDFFAKRGGLGTSRWAFRTESDNRLRFFRNDVVTQLSVHSAASSITLNKWQHVAMTWDGSSTATNVHIYIDGTEVSYAKQIDAVGVMVTDSSQVVRIGNNDVTDNGLDGFITEVAFWGSAILSLQQIKLLATSRVKGIPLQIVTTLGGLKGYWPLNEFTEAVAITGTLSIRDRSSNNNHGTPTFNTGGALPKAIAEQVLSYQP